MSPRRLKTTAAVAACGLLVAACNGHAVIVESRSDDAVLASDRTTASERGSTGRDVAKGAKGVNVGSSGATTSTSGTSTSGDANCATTSNPDEGFTEDTIKWGTIIPLTGSLRPLGEQVARVMKISVDRLNTIPKLPGPVPLNWGCSERPGIFGRKVELEVYSLQNNTPEEALGAMRRLIDVENVFLVRDCYLESNLMGPATQYQNQHGVPGVWCHFSEMKYPQLAPWTFNPGINPLMSVGIHTGYLINKLDKRRLAVLADPSTAGNQVRIVRQVAAHLDEPIPDDCIIYKKAQEASNGMRSEIAALRTCYGAGQAPDAVVALDALNAVFGAMEAKSQGWKGADNDVVWDCSGLSCWITVLADLCGDACEGMLTDCASLPCIPWASAKEYPAIVNFRDFHENYVPREPEDILTFAPAAITSGIALWLTMTGPDLSREKFAYTLENLKNWSSGIGSVITTSPEDHFGSNSVWIIEYTGRAPWFDDVTGRFLTLDEVGVPRSLVTD
jgi:hypothetical protein